MFYHQRFGDRYVHGDDPLPYFVPLTSFGIRPPSQDRERPDLLILYHSMLRMSSLFFNFVLVFDNFFFRLSNSLDSELLRFRLYDLSTRT